MTARLNVQGGDRCLDDAIASPFVKTALLSDDHAAHACLTKTTNECTTQLQWILVIGIYTIQFVLVRSSFWPDRTIITTYEEIKVQTPPEIRMLLRRHFLQSKELLSSRTINKQQISHLIGSVSLTTNEDCKSRRWNFNNLLTWRGNKTQRWRSESLLIFLQNYSWNLGFVAKSLVGREWVMQWNPDVVLSHV